MMHMYDATTDYVDPASTISVSGNTVKNDENELKFQEARESADNAKKEDINIEIKIDVQKENEHIKNIIKESKEYGLRDLINTSRDLINTSRNLIVYVVDFPTRKPLQVYMGMTAFGFAFLVCKTVHYYNAYEELLSKGYYLPETNPYSPSEIAKQLTNFIIQASDAANINVQSAVESGKNITCQIINGILSSIPGFDGAAEP